MRPSFAQQGYTSIPTGDVDSDLSASAAQHSEGAEDNGAMSGDTAGSGHQEGPKIRAQPSFKHRERQLQGGPKLPKMQNAIQPGSTPIGTSSQEYEELMLTRLFV